MKKASKKISEGLAKIGIAPPKEGEIKHITEEQMKLAQEIEDTGTEVETSDIEPNLFMSAEKRAEIIRPKIEVDRRLESLHPKGGL